MESPDSQPCGLTVLDDPGPFHDDDGEGKVTALEVSLFVVQQQMVVPSDDCLVRDGTWKWQY